MEIIDELEVEKRSFYAGAAGYFGFGGTMDLCIAIRTLLACGNRLYIQAGAGIVADSVPEREYRETLNKMQALKAAVEKAGESVHDLVH
jgi:anthranilate synthase component 1